jgi:hypothetical protein
VTGIILTQAEADDLIAIKKRSEHLDPVKLPDLGGTPQVPLVSVDFKEKFIRESQIAWQMISGGKRWRLNDIGLIR